MSTPTILTHEMVLTDGSTTLGLMCVRDKAGRPRYQHRMAPTFAQQQFTELGENAFVTENRLQVTYENWSKGFGIQNYKAKRYSQSFGCDASWEGGMITPGPVAVALTNSTPTYASTCTGANLDFETGDLTGWTETDAQSAGAVSSAAPQAGTYHYRFSYTNDLQARTINLKQKLTAADSSLFGSGSPAMELTITVYTRYNAWTPTTASFVLKDGSGTVIQAAVNIAVGTNYAQQTLTHTFTDGWPELWLHFDLYHDGGSGPGSTDIDSIVVSLSGTIGTATNTGTIVKALDFNGAHYFVSDTGVWKRTTNNLARIAGSPDFITDAASDGTNLYLARGTSKNYWYMATGETFTRNTGSAASSQPIKMAWIAGSMYGSDDPQTLWKYNALASGGTSNTFTIGETGYNFTALVNHLATPYVLKENTLEYISSTPAAVPNVDPALAGNYNANTGKNAVSYNGTLVYPSGIQDLSEYDAGTVDDTIAPSASAERLADFSGQVVALATDQKWLYAILDNSTKIEILKGKKRTIDGETRFCWHPFFEDTYTTVAYAHISSITAKRLYYGGGTALPKYIPLPTLYSDPLNDSNLTFLTAQTWGSGWLDLGLPNDPKVFKSLTLLSTGLSGTARTVKVEYKLLGDTNWTELGGTNNGTYNTSPAQEKFFASTSMESRKINLRFTLNTDSSATGLGIIGFSIYAVPNPVRLEVVDATITVSSGNRSSTGAPDTEMTYAQCAAQLFTWGDTYPLTLTVRDGTIDGAAYTVKMAPGYPKETVVDFGQPDSAKVPSAEIDVQFVQTRTS